MKKSFTKTLLLLTAALFTFSFASCKEEEDEEVKKEVYSIITSDTDYTRRAVITLYPEKHEGLFEEYITYFNSDEAPETDKTKFTYTQKVVNETRGTMTISVTALWDNDTQKWISIENAADYLKNLYAGSFLDEIALFITAEEKPTYENLYAAHLEAGFPADSYDDFLDDNSFNVDDNAETQAANVSELLNSTYKNYYHVSGTFAEYLEAFEADIEKKFEALFKCSIPDGNVFDYSILTSSDKTQYPDGKWFNYIRARFDSTKEWHDQKGRWVNGSNYLSLDEIHLGTVESDDISWNNDYSGGIYIDDDDNEYQFTVTDNQNQTITVTVNNEDTYNLTFHGLDLAEE